MRVARRGSRLISSWLVLVIGLLLTVGAAGFAYRQPPSLFQATARLMLLLPAEARRLPINPFLDRPYDMVTLSGMIGMIVDSDPFRLELQAVKQEVRYEVGLDPSVPIVTLSVEGSDPEDVVDARDWLVDRTRIELRAVQLSVGTPKQQVVTAHIFMSEPVAAPVAGDPVRSAAGIAAAGILLTVLLVGAVSPKQQVPRRSREGGIP